MTQRDRGGSALCWLLAASLGLVVGCSENSSGPTVSDLEAAQQQATAAVKAAKVSRAKRKRIEETKQRVKPIAGQGDGSRTMGSGVLIETGYAYTSEGKRDPFRSFTWNRPDRLARAEVAGPLEQFDLTQLEVVAVVWRTGNARALVQDPSGESYIVGAGAAIGKNQGRVVTIDDNTVVVKETYVDYLGQETTKDIEMRIRRSEGG